MWLSHQPNRSPIRAKRFLSTKTRRRDWARDSRALARSQSFSCEPIRRCRYRSSPTVHRSNPRAGPRHLAPAPAELAQLIKSDILAPPEKLRFYQNNLFHEEESATAGNGVLIGLADFEFGADAGSRR